MSATRLAVVAAVVVALLFISEDQLNETSSD
jgi:hypothetical protein